MKERLFRTAAEETAFWEGYACYQNSGALYDCPYTAVGEENLWDAWRDGFNAAAWDD